jgi:hypothetical protein
MGAAAEVDVTDAIARVDEPLDCLVGEMPTMTQMDIVKVLAEPRDGEDGSVRDIPALSEHEVAKSRGNVDDLFDGAVGQARARREIQNAEMFVRLVRRERQEGAVIDEFAVGKPQLAERAAFGEESSYRLVLDEATLVEVDFENVGTMLGKGEDGVVGQLMTVIQF